MKFNKLFLFVTMLAAGMAFTSCDNEDEYVPGLPAGEHNIGFESEENMVLAMTQESFEVELTRANTEGYLAVPLEALIVPEFVTLPDSARFEDGSATATIEVLVDSTMALFTDFQLSFRVPESYTNAYAEDGKNPVFNITIKKDDFGVVAVGVYKGAMFSSPWNQTVEYSNVLGLYRIPDCYGAGTHWYFQFDGADGFAITDSEGEPVSKFMSGYPGLVLTVLNAAQGYFAPDAEGFVGMFKFPFQFDLDGSTLGQAYDKLYIAEWIEKPWEAEVAE